MTMNDQPRKTLSLKKKRVIKRADIPAGKLTKPGKAPAKPTKAKSQKTRPPAKKKPEFSPSEIRARELYQRLNDFEVWRSYKPLALGIEKAIFKLCNDEKIPGASKKVVNKVLSRHTRRDVYRANVLRGGKRYQLDAKEGGEISEEQKAHAARAMKAPDKNLQS